MRSYTQKQNGKPLAAYRRRFGRLAVSLRSAWRGDGFRTIAANVSRFLSRTGRAMAFVLTAPFRMIGRGLTSFKSWLLELFHRAAVARVTLQKKVIIFVLVLLAAGLGLYGWLGISSVNESIDRVFEGQQAEEESLALTRLLQQRFLLLGGAILIGGGILTWVMMQGVVIPIRILTAAAKRVASGDFETAIPLGPQSDEIGEASGAFKLMTHELARYRDELTQRNQELSALNSITATVSQSLALEDVLENALQKVLEITKAGTGCVFLRIPGEDRLKLMAMRGSATIFQCQEAGTAGTNCACHQVLAHGQLLSVDDISRCPRLMGAVADGINFFISVPLKSKDKTLGIMNLTGSSSHGHTARDFNLLASIGTHVGLSVENALLYEEARQKEKLRGQLLQSAITAQEDERKRIARELHDELGQTLTALIMSIESLEKGGSPQQPQLKEKLSGVKGLVSRTLDDVRRLTLDLRPSVLDDLGLFPAVRGYVQSRLGSAGIQSEFEIMGKTKRIDPVVETALFRIIQEAVNNIVKHARASHARIRLEMKDDMITATVEDDGQGFDIEATFESRVGKKALGLLGIKERVILLGGSFDISSGPGKGTQLAVRIPLAAPVTGNDNPGSTRVPKTGVG